MFMTENELATTAVDICYKLHTTLGPGLLESVYEAAFIYELELRGIPYTRQEAIPAIYANVILDVGFRADIVMDDKLLIEIKWNKPDFVGLKNLLVSLFSGSLTLLCSQSLPKYSNNFSIEFTELKIVSLYPTL